MSDKDANKKVGNVVSARTVLLTTMATAGVIAVNMITAIVLSTIAFLRTSHCSAVSNYSTTPTNTVRNGDFFQLASGTISSVEVSDINMYITATISTRSVPILLHKYPILIDTATY